MKSQRKFEKLLNNHGLALRYGSKHFLITRNDKVVGSMSHTASDQNAYREIVRILVRDGLLPNEAKRQIKF